jgi:hypothetical protein
MKKEVIMASKGIRKYRRRVAFCKAHCHDLGQTGVKAKAYLIKHKIQIPPDPQAKPKVAVKPPDHKSLDPRTANRQFERTFLLPFNQGFRR